MSESNNNIVKAVIDETNKTVSFTTENGVSYTNPGYGSTHYSERYTQEQMFSSLKNYALLKCPDNISYIE